MKQVTLRVDVAILVLITAVLTAYIVGNTFSEMKVPPLLSSVCVAEETKKPCPSLGVESGDQGGDQSVARPSTSSAAEGPPHGDEHVTGTVAKGGSDEVVVEETAGSLANISGVSFDEADDPPMRVLAEAWEGKTTLIQLIETSSSNGGNSSSTPAGEAAAKFVGALDALLTDALNNSRILTEHDSYIVLRRLLQNRALKYRRKFVLNEEEAQSRTNCFQYVRADQRNVDAISHIPCVPWNSTNLHTVALARHGVLANFHHIAPPVRASLPIIRGERPTGVERPLRVAVEMSGQMRTYKSCWESLRKHILEPNQALLFMASYPDVGDKRFGVRVLERDDVVPIDRIAEMFSPFLASFYVTDLPSVTNRLKVEFPTLFVQTQFSWMLYQLFMMDLAHTLVMHHSKGPLWVDGMDAPFVVNKEGRLPVFKRDAGEPAINTEGGIVERPPIEWVRAAASPWRAFDIVIRVRPDIFILGPLWIRPLSADSAVLNFTCNPNAAIGLPPLSGPEQYVHSKQFSRGDLLRTPHHPVHEWILDPISDHTAVGFTDQVTTFFELYKDARALSPRDQEKNIFFAGNTVERMWTQHTERKGLKVETTFGWHIMLRNPTNFLNSTNLLARTKRRKELMIKIFAVTDPEQVGCPAKDGSMTKLPPKPKGKVTVIRRYVRRG